MDAIKGKPTSTCTNCKKRKVKCDRRVPCGACIKIKSGFSCHYETKWKSISFHKLATGDNSGYPDMSISASRLDLEGGLTGIEGDRVDHHQGDTTYRNELTTLKRRLKELESSLESLASQPPKQAQKVARLADFPVNTYPAAATTALENSSSTNISINNVSRSLSHSTSPLQSSSINDAAGIYRGNYGSHSPTDTERDRDTSLLETIDYSYLTNPHLLNPRDEDSAVINFYEGYTSIQVRSANRRHNLGPLTWSCTMRKDPWINMIYDIITPARGKLELLLGRNTPALSKKNTTLITTHDDDDPRNEKTFERIQLETEGYDEVVPFKDIGVKQSAEKNSHRGSDNIGPAAKKTKTLNVTSITLAKTLFDGRFDPELRLVEQIQTILPVKRVIWSLIDRFFKVLYPLYPFLDEIDFRNRLSAILGPATNEETKLTELKIEYRLDLALMATLLVVLRLTYLSLFSNRDCKNSETMHSASDDPDEQERKYLLSNPINVVAINVAHACLCCFQISVRTNLTVFQATLLLRLYRTLGPEEGDRFDGGELQFSTAMLVQMGYSLGLHREPDNFTDLRIDERTNHLCRKLWYFLILSDLLNAFNSGNPTLIDVKHYDTKEPVATPSNSSLVDFALEESAVETLKWLDVSLTSIGKILDVIVDIRKYSSINHLTEALNNIEQVLRVDFQVTNSPANVGLSHRTEFTDVIKTKVFLTIYCSLITIYVHLYLYYEKQSKFDFSFFYLKKLLYIIQQLIVPLIFEVLFGNFSDCGLILNPTLLLAIHKCNQVVLSCYARVNYVKYAMEKNKNHLHKLDVLQPYRQSYEKYCGLSAKLETVGALILSIILKLSSRYYYAWRILKAHRILFKNYSGTQLYQKVTRTAKTLHSFQFTSTQLEEFDAMVSKLIEWLKYVDSYRDNPSKVPRFMDENNAYPPLAEGESTPSLRSEDSAATDPTYVDKMWMSMLAMKNHPATLPQPSTTDYPGRGVTEETHLGTTAQGGGAEANTMDEFSSGATSTLPSIPSLDQWVGSLYMAPGSNQVPERPMYTNPYQSLTGGSVGMGSGSGRDLVGALNDLLSEDIESLFNYDLDFM